MRAVALADVPLTRADLVLMAGDVDGALAALKLLRDDGVEGDVPVILLGLPPGSAGEAPEGPAFGADAVLARPIDYSGSGDIELVGVLAYLIASYPSCRVFAISPPSTKGNAATPVFVGATPECLVRMDRQEHKKPGDCGLSKTKGIRVHEKAIDVQRRDGRGGYACARPRAIDRVAGF